MQNKILIVDDEPSIREGLQTFLSAEGYQVLTAADGKAGDLLIKTQSPCLIVLDWSLPDIAGIDWLKKWRSEGLTIPVIMLTSRSHVIDKVLGLELGADDFVTKPFEPRELLARIHARLRAQNAAQVNGRQSSKEAEELVCGRIIMRLTSHEVLNDGQTIELSKMEWSLLRLFIENPDKVYAREELLNQVWGFENYPTTRTVDTHVMQLRQKFGAECFETVRGVGYRFRVPGHQSK